MGKVLNYVHTIRHLRTGQVWNRAIKPIKITISKFTVKPGFRGSVEEIKFLLEQLDLDKKYLAHFNKPEILNHTFTFLSKKEIVDLSTGWNDLSLPQLWRDNLHYFNYVHILIHGYLAKKELRYYKCFKDIVKAWIHHNSDFTSDGWQPYTISMRIPNWLCAYSGFVEEINKEEAFRKIFIESLYMQYKFLIKNMEYDVLGNHLLENIKAVIAGSIFFKDSKTLEKALKLLRSELKEQILEDGVHFELSPMYHKMVFEDVLKICWWLKNVGQNVDEFLPILKGMASFIHSIEKNMGHSPLFNDSGEGTTKDFEVLIDTAKSLFDISPVEKNVFDKSGYYIMGNASKKLVIDCGKISPDHLPAHGHCDALSYEMSVDNSPFIVNSGTFEYQQGKWRQFFRSTRAHNTVVIGDAEQSEFWHSFRVGRRIYGGKAEFVSSDGYKYLRGSYYNYLGEKHSRCIAFVQPDVMLVADSIKCASEKSIKNYLHLFPDYSLQQEGKKWNIEKNGKPFGYIIPISAIEVKHYCGNEENGWYSPEFGTLLKNHVLEVVSTSSKSYIGYVIVFGSLNVDVRSAASGGELLLFDIEGVRKSLDLKNMLPKK